MSKEMIETGTEQLMAEVQDGVAVLTMNRTERRNALTREMLDALTRVLAQIELDPEVRAIVLTGAGGAFCAGGDVKGMAAAGDGTVGALTIDQAIHRQRVSQRTTAGKIFEMPKPVIAAIGGPAAGAGFSLALACDLRVMADSTFMTSAFARVGFSGDYGGTYFLTNLVGTAKAREIYYLSERISAEEAQRLGLANWVVPKDRVMEKAMEIARRIADGPTVAFRYMKENLNRALNGEMGECLDLEVTHHVHTGQTEDHREAARAFVEKREPKFKGR